MGLAAQMGLCGRAFVLWSRSPCIAFFELSCLFPVVHPDTGLALSLQREPPSVRERLPPAPPSHPLGAPCYTWHLGKHGLSAGLFPGQGLVQGWADRREMAPGPLPPVRTCARHWGPKGDSDLSFLDWG